MWLLQGNTATLPVETTGIRARKTEMKAKRGIQGDKIRRLTHERRNDSGTQILFRPREDSGKIHTTRARPTDVTVNRRSNNGNMRPNTPHPTFRQASNSRIKV